MMTSASSLARLEREGKLRRQEADLDYLEDLLAAAGRNFEAGRLLLGQADEAAFKLDYDGLLQVSRAILLSRGYRPDDGEQHRTTFLAAGEILGPHFEDVIRKIQKFRIKRNACLYNPGEVIGKSEAGAIHKTAQEFWVRVREHLKRENPQLALFDEIY
jgi:hypothetical protein